MSTRIIRRKGDKTEICASLTPVITRDTAPAALVNSAAPRFETMILRTS